MYLQGLLFKRQELSIPVLLKGKWWIRILIFIVLSLGYLAVLRLIFLLLVNLLTH